MASKANQRRSSSDKRDVITRLCSINTTGLVFYSSRRLKLSSEISFSIETKVFGFCQEWSLQGWVVECRHVRDQEDANYQITLLFSDLPKGLQQVLATAEGEAKRAYPAVADAPMFGLN